MATLQMEHQCGRIIDIREAQQTQYIRCWEENSYFKETGGSWGVIIAIFCFSLLQMQIFSFMHD